MKNIDLIRLIGIWFMVTAHIGATGLSELVSGQPLYLFLIDGLSRLSSPVLGFISGYFAFRSVTTDGPARIIARKGRSLLLPFLLWSFIYVALLTGVRLLETGRLDLALFLSNEFWGLTAWPGNFPLHYLIDLFKCLMLAGAAFWLLSRFGIARGTALRIIFGTAMLLFVVLTLADLNHEHPGRHRDDVLPRTDLVLFFFLGLAYAGASSDGIMKVADRPAVMLLLGVVFVASSMIWADLLKHETGTLAYALGVVLHFACRIAGGVLLFALIQRLPTIGQAAGLAMRRLAFRIFVSHFIVFSALSSVIDLGPLMAASPLLFILMFQVTFALFAALMLALEGWIAAAMQLGRGQAAGRPSVLLNNAAARPR
ncbi:MAG: acyltransferase [Rhizobiales bacterium]|nr:acyltransferase [Hyphomicrobiales bacterium]